MLLSRATPTLSGQQVGSFTSVAATTMTAHTGTISGVANLTNIQGTGISDSLVLSSSTTAASAAAVSNCWAGCVHTSGGIVSGTLGVSNLNVLGTFMTVNATEVVSSNMVVSNFGTGPALSVTQSETGVFGAQPVATFNAGSNVGLVVTNSGGVAVGKSTASYALDVSGDIATSGKFRGDGSLLVNLPSSGSSSGGDPMAWAYLQPNATNASAIISGMQASFTTRANCWWATTSNICSFNSESVDVFSPGVLSTTTKTFIGSITVPSGNVVCVPFQSSAIMTYNPGTGTSNFATANVPTIVAGCAYFYGAVLLPDGNVCMIPNTGTYVTIFNPTSNAVINNFSVGSTSPLYAGGCLMGDGRVFMVPGCVWGGGNTNSNGYASTIGIFDSKTYTYSTIDVSGIMNTVVNSDNGSYCGCTLTPSGKVVLCPSGFAPIGLFDPKTNTLSLSSANLSTGYSPAFDGNYNAFFNSVLVLPSGKLLFVPGHVSDIDGNDNTLFFGLYDITTDTMTMTSYTFGTAFNSIQFTRSSLLPDGRVLVLPSIGGISSAIVGVFDPIAITFSKFIISLNSRTPAGIYMYTSVYGLNASLLFDGRLFLTPATATVGSAGFTWEFIGQALPPPRELCLHPFYNRF